MIVFFSPCPQYYIIRKTVKEDNPGHEMPQEVKAESEEDGKVYVKETFVEREKT